MKLAIVLVAATLLLPGRARAELADQHPLMTQGLEPPVVQIDLTPRRPPTPRFLVEQGLVSVGLQAAFVGVTVLLVAVVANHLSPTDVTSNTLILIAASIPTTLGYVFVPSIVLSKMADRRMSSVYFQQVFWASGVASSFWTLAILATDTQQGGSIPLALGFGIAGIFLTAALQVWMGYMDWDTDPPDRTPVAALAPSPPARAVAGYSAPSMPTPPGISLISWRF